MFDDDDDNRIDSYPEIPRDLKSVPGQEKTRYIEYVHEDYKFCLASKMSPQIIRYYRDVLVDLVKTYGH